MQKFNAILEAVEGKGGAYVRIPFNVEEIFGQKRVKVKATFDGIEYRGSIVRMGMDCHIIGVTKEVRNKAKKDIGDTIYVTVVKDEEEREVDVPDELKVLLEKNKETNEFWNKLSYSNKKKYIVWINSAKKIETFNKRIETTIDKLVKGEKM